MTIAPKLGRIHLYNEQLPSIKSLDSLVLQGKVIDYIIYISPATSTLAIKFGKMMSYYMEPPTIKSLNLLKVVL